MRRQGRVWIRIFPDIPVSTKPAEVRQGKGKGTPEYWIARVKRGRIIFELDGVSEVIARRAFELASAKLPNQTNIYPGHGTSSTVGYELQYNNKFIQAIQ